MWKLNIKFTPAVGGYYKALYLPAGDYVRYPNGKTLYFFSPECAIKYVLDPHYWTHSLPGAFQFIKPVIKEHFVITRIEL